MSFSCSLMYHWSSVGLSGLFVPTWAVFNALEWPDLQIQTEFCWKIPRSTNPDKLPKIEVGWGTIQTETTKWHLDKTPIFRIRLFLLLTGVLLGNLQKPLKTSKHWNLATYHLRQGPICDLDKGTYIIVNTCRIIEQMTNVPLENIECQIFKMKNNKSINHI